MPAMHGRTEDHGQHHEGGSVAVGRILRRLVGAGVVEVDVLLQDGIGLEPDLVDRLGVQVMGFTWESGRPPCGTAP